MRRTLIAVAAALLLAACGEGEAEYVEAGGTWSRLPAAPLSPREDALGVWTGREALIIGGSDVVRGPYCHNKKTLCALEKTPPARDGAAFDPRKRSWRKIADAPVGFEFGFGVVAGSTVYVGASGTASRPGAPPALLAYRVDRDRWQRLALPPGLRRFGLVALNDRLVAYSTKGGRSRPRDMVLRQGAKAWRTLPRDPLPPSHERSMGWNGRELVLFTSQVDTGTDPPRSLARPRSTRTRAAGGGCPTPRALATERSGCETALA